MIKFIKNLIKKNQAFADFCRKAEFFMGSFPQDIFNFRKLLLFKKVYPYTMVTYKKLSNMYDLSKLVEKEKIKGAFVECGVWKGGCVAVAAFNAKRAESERKIWLFDSFEGLPEPTKEDGIVAKEYSGNKADGKLKAIDRCVGPMEDVKNIFFNILKINPENIVIKKGWFQDTLPVEKNKIGPIAILRMDGDWYESTKCCLDNLYDNIVSGGYVVEDDYGHWEGSRKAIDEFLERKGLSPTIVKIDYAGIYFKKP